MSYKRYAIFYTPPPGFLADFGAAWLGWDPVQGTPVAHPELEGVAISEVTKTPRKYGFHGTLKPPFTLAKGQSEAALRAAFATFCASAQPVVLQGLELARLGGFLALLPHCPNPALKALAADIVREFDRFRAPMSAQVQARWQARKLSPEQEEMLAQWGYPYVMQEAQFHMTLSGRLPRAQALQIIKQLNPLISPMIAGVFKIDALSLMGEDAAGMFHLLERKVMPG